MFLLLLYHFYCYFLTLFRVSTDFLPSPTHFLLLSDHFSKLSINFTFFNLFLLHFDHFYSAFPKFPPIIALLQLFLLLFGHIFYIYDDFQVFHQFCPFPSFFLLLVRCYFYFLTIFQVFLHFFAPSHSYFLLWANFCCLLDQILIVLVFLCFFNIFRRKGQFFIFMDAGSTTTSNCSLRPRFLSDFSPVKQKKAKFCKNTIR